MADGVRKTVAFLATYVEELVRLQKPALEAVLKSNRAKQVKDFAKCAIRGVPCTVVNPQTGQASGASYFLDPKIQRLVFKRSQTPETVIANIQMENIKDVLVDSGVSEKVISKHDVNRLAILTFQNGDPSVFILEGSQVDRDRFALCVKILRPLDQGLNLTQIDDSPDSPSNS